MPTTTQFVISGQSKPGTLAKVASVLGEAGVNIKAFSAPEVTGTGKLRMASSASAELRVMVSTAPRSRRPSNSRRSPPAAKQRSPGRRPIPHRNSR